MSFNAIHDFFFEFTVIDLRPLYVKSCIKNRKNSEVFAKSTCSEQRHEQRTCYFPQCGVHFDKCRLIRAMLTAGRSVHLTTLFPGQA